MELTTKELVKGIRAQVNIPNALTAYRAMSPVFIIPLIYFEYWDYALLVYILSAATDMEGSLARLLDAKTELGRVFDPIADKIFTNLTMLPFVFLYGSPWLLGLFVINLGYDMDNTARRLRVIVAACLNQRSIEETSEEAPVTWVSKLKTAVLFLVIGLLFLTFFTPASWQKLESFGQVLQPVVDQVDYGILLAIILVGWSWLSNRRSTLTSFYRRFF